MKTHDGFITMSDGVRLFFRLVEGGDKLPLIFPNGFYLETDFARLWKGRRVVIYDLRNRGYSDAVTDEAKLARGILQDVDDLDLVRHHFGFAQMDLLAHSYVGVTAALYAMQHPARVRQLVQLAPAPADAAKPYPPELSANDGVAASVFAAVGELQKQRGEFEAAEFCRRVWKLLGRIYVLDAKQSGRAQWGRCDLPNERGFMKYWLTHLQPSLQRLKLTAEDFAKVTAPVLTMHGRHDRSAPYGGGRDWPRALPNARLLTIEKACHAPWVEAPEKVFGAIETFLQGSWPAGAENVDGKGSRG